MIFHQDTPDTTMDEDLLALGLGKLLTETRRMAAQPSPAAPAAGRAGGPGVSLPSNGALMEGKQAKPAVKPSATLTPLDDPTDDPGRTEVGVRDEDIDPIIEGDEVFDFAEAEGFDPIDVLTFLESTNEVGGDLLESLLSELDESDLEGFLEDVLAEGCSDDDDDDDDDDDKPAFLKMKKGPKSEAAEFILRTFYEQMENVAEDDDRPSYDDLVGVIEAYECIAEDLLQEVIFGKKGSAAGRGKRRAMKKGKWKRLKRFVAKAHKMGKHLVGGVKMTGSKLRQHLMKARKGAKSARYKRSIMKKMRGLKHSTVSHVEPEGEPISELEQGFADLRDTVSEAELEEGFINASNELIEGLKAVYDASTEWFEKIAEEVKEEENLSEDDARVAMGRHLEMIAEDAARIAELIAEGEADIDDAADDLASLGADLDDALEAMKGID